ncbi:MAG: Gfo/Idh/MocA family oxidoreductase [Candidatus Hydrogenedentes bacterium]|nr:Gfo/Idh/MocA family oxidoreductase [Candidatus Hydrogenedentota bacterium]
MKPMRTGIMGCGNISQVYFEAAGRLDALDIVACADLDRTRAEEKAGAFPGVKAMTPKALLADKSIGLVLNLTVPKAHADVTLAALQAGKHIYSEKPLALTREEALAIGDLARKKGRVVGCAPDTFLGAGIQTARKLVDDGWIGTPVAATAYMMCHGHESWHPAPEFYYEAGGGPLFDMGPYYLTALVTLLGPVARVCASARASFPDRLITSEPQRGKRITVETPTHIAGVLDFDTGAIGNLIMSFDVWDHHLPCIEIYGSGGSLQLPDPNTFGGTLLYRRAGAAEWSAIPHTHGYAEQSRGIGAADLVQALEEERPPRASLAMASHVLDVMHGFLKSSESGRHIRLESRCERPAAMPLGESR